MLRRRSCLVRSCAYLLDENLSSKEDCNDANDEDGERGSELSSIASDLLRSSIDEACGWSCVVETDRRSVWEEGRRLNERGVRDRSRVEDASRSTVDDGR